MMIENIRFDYLLMETWIQIPIPYVLPQFT